MGERHPGWRTIMDKEVQIRGRLSLAMFASLNLILKKLGCFETPREMQHLEQVGVRQRKGSDLCSVCHFVLVTACVCAHASQVDV